MFISVPQAETPYSPVSLVLTAPIAYKGIPRLAAANVAQRVKSPVFEKIPELGTRRSTPLPAEDNLSVRLEPRCGSNPSK